VDNNIIGSGNLTFKNLDPGTHPVEISQSGYQTWKGTVRLKGGETYTLQVALEKIRTAQTSSPAAETPQYTAEDFYQSGLAMLSAGKAAEAIKDLNQAIDMKPSLADAYRARAEACLATGNNNAAHDDYIRAGEINFSQKRLESALSLFNKALAINDKSMAALLNIGDCYNEQNDRNEALRYYKNVLTIDDNNFKANFEIGKIYFALGKNRDADKKLRLARELNPSVPEVYHYLMLNHLARDDIKNVEKAYADFQLNVSPKAVEDFRSDRRFDALHRIVGEYERP